MSRQQKDILTDNHQTTRVSFLRGSFLFTCIRQKTYSGFKKIIQLFYRSFFLQVSLFVFTSTVFYHITMGTSTLIKHQADEQTDGQYCPRMLEAIIGFLCLSNYSEDFQKPSIHFHFVTIFVLE